MNLLASESIAKNIEHHCILSDLPALCINVQGKGKYIYIYIYIYTVYIYIYIYIN
jgi:hypothetical protein